VLEIRCRPVPAGAQEGVSEEGIMGDHWSQDPLHLHAHMCRSVFRCLGSCLQLLVMPPKIWSVPTITIPRTLPCPLSGSLFVHCSGSMYIPARLPLYLVIQCGTSHVQDRVAWRIPNQATSLPYQDRSTPKTAHNVSADCLHSRASARSPLPAALSALLTA
jgi:hypothetical protein